MRAIATWCFHHRKSVIALWLLALLVSLGISSAVGSDYANDAKLPNTESTRAIHLLEASSPAISGDTEQIVIGTYGGAKVTDRAVAAQFQSVLRQLGDFESVTGVISPYGKAAVGRISKDGTVAFATVQFSKIADNLSKKLPKKFVKAAQSINSDTIKVQVSGRIGQLSQGQSIGGTGPGILCAAIVLFFVFGSIFAMALPLLSAAVALGTALGIIGLLSNLIKMPVFSSELVLLVGLGVGVDYALFIVTRHRQGLIAGKTVEESAITAANTSGRAVLFAGIIVCIALLGMFALGVAFLYGLAVAAAIGVFFTMIAALTLIPALLGFIGHRVMSRKQRRYLKEHGPRVVGSSGFWKRWATMVMERPVISAASALSVIVLIAIPLQGMRLGASDDGNNKKGTITRDSYDLLAKGFGPGFNGPMQVVGKIHTVKERAAYTATVSAIAHTSGVAAVAPVTFIPTPDKAFVGYTNVYATTAPQDVKTEKLINHLRHDVIPGNEGPTLKVYVGGATAVYHDFAEVLGQKLPLFIGIVVLMAFLLLVIVFRSIVVPVTAAIMNLLSAAAAFGMLTAVYQWGWLSSVFGVGRTGPIEPFIPVMLFAILFGLSMDYEVFLISRIHEEWVRTGDNQVAVRNGLATTGKTISAAALIMILVFGSFMLGGERVIKEFGLGLAGGILMDAIIIRGAVIPAVMQVIGKANWWLPSWLDRRIPVVHVDAPEESHDELPAEPVVVESADEVLIVEVTETVVAPVVAKKAPAKKVPAKKTVAKKAPVKKAPATAAPTKAVAKKTVAKKAPVKKAAPAKKAPVKKASGR